MHWPWIWDSFKRLNTNWSVSFKFVDKHVLCWGTMANIDQHLSINDKWIFNCLERFLKRKAVSFSQHAIRDMLKRKIDIIIVLLLWSLQIKQIFLKFSDMCIDHRLP